MVGLFLFGEFECDFRFQFMIVKKKLLTMDMLKPPNPKWYQDHLKHFGGSV